ncbi:hypothetical protein L9F63_005758, partial [Diploptera punctata]
VFANMSGLVVITEDGTVESCNHYFTHMMFGYPQSELVGQTDDDNDNSNYDSALENTDQDKSRNSRKDTGTIELERSSHKELSDGNATDVVNANNSVASVSEIVDSMNRLNLGFAKESSSSSPFCNESSLKQHSIFTLNQSPLNITNGDDLSTCHDEGACGKPVPPMTLNFIASSDLADIENCSDNGELTPIVTSRNDFVEYDDNFETASDGEYDDEDEDDDSIEVIQNGHEVDGNKSDNCKMPLKSYSGENSQDCRKSIDVIVGQLTLEDNSDADSDKENRVEKSNEGNEKEKNSEVDVRYYEKKVTDTLNLIKLDESKELSVIPGSPTLEDDSLDRTVDVLLLTSTPAVGKRLGKKRMSRDIEDKLELASEKKFVDGSYVGFGRHHDGSNLDIVYRVREIQKKWQKEDATGGGNLTLTSSFNSTVDNSLGQAIRSCAQSNIVPQQPSTRPGSVSVLSQCEDEQTCGDYGEHYTTLQQIGKGAFGYVKWLFAMRWFVITKFIQKHKVHQQSWVEDPTLGRKVPLEISLLTTLKHPNIVHVLDVFENPKFFQLVMEKHGAGMDLFEFIDRKPYLDESLNSYIFRQIVSAVDYLHSLQILHRDIKDENVIINERFHAKLIDFGSATFMSDGRLFSTFYGTVEYCSPEVLAGNKYEGPELEMWSLGVTLYVMTFGENPFFDVEEIMRAEMHPPCKVSDELMELLHWMLAKDPHQRCKVQQLVSHNWINKEVDMSSYCFQDVVSCHPQEAHPPVYYADYRCDSANDSLSNRFPITESSSAVLSNNEEDSNADDRTVGSSNSLGSLTTVENFETEEDAHYQHPDSKPIRTEDCMAVDEEESVPSTKTNPGKETHSQEEDVAVEDDKHLFL